MWYDNKNPVIEKIVRLLLKQRQIYLYLYDKLFLNDAIEFKN